MRVSRRSVLRGERVGVELKDGSRVALRVSGWGTQVLQGYRIVNGKHVVVPVVQFARVISFDR